MRLEQLKSKSRQEQSAVASPEVKRHLQEFVLQKKRKEQAVGSMSNLKMATATHTAPSTPPHALLRKTASESNLLKMKPVKRSMPGSSTPYQRAANHREHCLRETAVMGGGGSSCGSLQVSISFMPLWFKVRSFYKRKHFVFWCVKRSIFLIHSS